MRLSIVIPCYNEEAIIENTAEKVAAYLAQNYSDTSYEILLVNDGSTDQTFARMQDAHKKNNYVVPLGYPFNQGRGAAIKKGIKESKGELVIVLDADLSYDVEHIGSILNPFQKDNNLDVVVISPYMKGGSVSGVPFFRLMLSKIANWILAGFFDSSLSTVTCVVRGYRGSLIRGIPLFENGKELHLEILRKLYIKGAKILEIPGRLAWKETKGRAKRKGLKVLTSGTKHILWGLLSKPTRLLNTFTFLTLFIGFYELVNVLLVFFRYYQEHPDFWYGVWQGLNATFQHSPHTVIIASVALIIGMQSLFFLALFLLLKIQQEETLKHLLHLSSKDIKG